MFVGHIAAATSVAELRSLFGRAGRVLEVTIVAEHGFVNFGEEREARDAIERYNGRLLHGRAIHVDYSDEFASFLLRHRGEKVRFTRDRRTQRRRRRRRATSPAGGRPHRLVGGRS